MKGLHESVAVRCMIWIAYPIAAHRENAIGYDSEKAGDLRIKSEDPAVSPEICVA